MFVRHLWVRAALVSLLAIVAALMAPLSNLLPFQLQASMNSAALRDLLDILTSSMLTVTTFSLSIMVSAHLAADDSATPRAHRLLQQDSRTQTVMATFIGAFIYALTMTIMLSADIFAEDEIALLYLFTVGVIGLVVVAIIRWVGHLDGLGSTEATIRRCEERAKWAVRIRRNAPFLGARSNEGVAVPAGAHEVRAADCGYVSALHAGALNERAESWDATVHVAVAPGDWVVTGDLLAHVAVEEWHEDRAGDVRKAIPVSEQREHGHDTAFSLVVLAEIAERALSPGINDPRTGLDVIGRLTRLMLSLPHEREMKEPTAPRVFMRGLDAEEILRNTLDAIARDGKGFHEVLVAVQRSAASLTHHPDPGMSVAARTLSARALAYAREGITLAEDLERIGRAAVAEDPAPATGETKAPR